MENYSTDPNRESRNRSPKVESAVNAWISEYHALRTEIEWLNSDGSRYQTFAISLLSVVGGVIGWLSANTPTILLPALLIIPFIFCLLGFLYLRQHEEVFVIASYIKDYIRPRLRELTKDQSLWGWEEFKWQKLNSRKHAQSKWFTVTEMVFFLRGMLFIMPSIAALIAVLLFLLYTPPTPVEMLDNQLFTLFILLGFLIDTLFVVILMYSLISRGRNLPKEIIKKRQ